MNLVLVNDLYGISVNKLMYGWSDTGTNNTGLVLNGCISDMKARLLVLSAQCTALVVDW